MKHDRRSHSPLGLAGQACPSLHAARACPQFLFVQWFQLDPGGHQDPNFEDKLQLEILQCKTICKDQITALQVFQTTKNILFHKTILHTTNYSRNL